MVYRISNTKSNDMKPFPNGQRQYNSITDNIYPNLFFSFNSFLNVYLIKTFMEF